MKFSGKLLISDLDLTLLNDEKKISEKNIQAIKYFVDKGGRFTVATGRSFAGAKPYLDLLPINAPVITYNGALISDRLGNELWSSYLPGETVNYVYKCIDLFKSIGVQIYTPDKMYVVKKNCETEAHMKREIIPHEYCGINDVPNKWIKILMADDPEVLDKAKEYLDGMNPPFRTVKSEIQFLEFLETNTCKGNAMKKISQMIKIDTSDVIAVGDNMNDYEMIVNAGIGVAVDNAFKDVKNIADIICTDNNSSPLAWIVNYYEKLLTF